MRKIFVLNYKLKKAELERGFSLFELVIVFLVAGILGAIAAPNLLGLLARQNLNQALSQTESALREAQRQSIRRSKRCEVELSSNKVANPSSPSTYTVGSNTYDYERCLLSARNFSSKQITIRNNFSGDRIKYGASGNITNGGTITFSHSQLDTSVMKCIVISSPLGVIRSGDYTGGTSTPTASSCTSN